MSVTAVDMPVGEFCRWLSLEAGISIVVAERLDGAPVNLEVAGQTVDDVLALVARRVGAEVTRTGDLYYLGDLGPADRGVLVRRVRRLDAAEASSAVSVLLSDIGKVQSYPAGLLVVGDRVEVLQRIADMLDRVEDVPAVTWCVQLYLVSASESSLRDLGLDVEPALDVAMTFSAASAAGGTAAGLASGLARSTQLDGALHAMLRAASTRGDMAVVAEPLFVLVDGSKAEFSRGQTVPVPTKTTSNQGTVSTTGYQQVKTGVIVGVAARELSDSVVRLTVEVELSEISGYVDAAPIRDANNFTTEADLCSGGVYLLGSLERSKRSEERRKWLSFGQRQQSVAETVQVWARAYRVALDVGEPARRPRPAAADEPAQPSPSEPAGQSAPSPPEVSPSVPRMPSSPEPVSGRE